MESLLSSSASLLRGAERKSAKALTQWTDLPARVSAHLVAVYRTLFVLMLVASLGTYAHVSGALQLGAGVASIGMFVALFAFASMRSGRSDSTAARVTLGVFAALQGQMLAPLVEHALDLDASIVLLALSGTAIVFGSLSAAALLSPRRSFLYLGGTLFAALTWMFWLGLFSRLFGIGTHLMFNVSLYGGLLMFTGYVVYDTQMIVERAAAGSYDVLGDALGVFIDLVAIFVRILIIMIKNAEKKRKD